MRTYEFALIIEGGDVMDDDTLGALESAGCDDATFGVMSGVQYGEFTRDAISLLDALVSAVTGVESVSGLRVRHIEPEPLVTASEIAERLEKSPEYIRLLANGERGGGQFPAPVSHMRTRQRLWRWSDVAQWADQIKPEDLEDARVLAAFNCALEGRVVHESMDPKAIQRITDAIFAAT